MPVGPLIFLKQDLDGTIESRDLGFNFANNLATGDSLTGTPVIEQSNETIGATPLTFGTPAVSGALAVVRVSGGTLGATYDVSCTVQTLVNGDTLVGSCGIKIIPSK